MNLIAKNTGYNSIPIIAIIKPSSKNTTISHH